MSEIGRLKPRTPNDLTHLSGQVQTLEIHLGIRLEGDPGLCDMQSPSHRIFARMSNGPEILVGGAWLKTTKHGPRAGEKFLSLSIDDPSLPRALNVAAFPDQSGVEWIIVWRRRGVQPVEAAAQA